MTQLTVRYRGPADQSLDQRVEDAVGQRSSVKADVSGSRELRFYFRDPRSAVAAGNDVREKVQNVYPVLSVVPAGG